MDRRNFFKSVGMSSVALSSFPVLLTTEQAKAQGAASTDLVAHCKKILVQNLLKSGEFLIIATPYVYDQEYFAAMLAAAHEVGAIGVHVAVLPRVENGKLVSGLTAAHWELYAAADLLITSSLGAPQGMPGSSTAYTAKVGKHGYRTDFESISRPGSKTRWLALGYTVPLQKKYFPNAEREALTLKGAKILDKVKQIQITSAAGSNLTISKEGRPGHAQYGIADYPGRWDNYGYGCVACGPVETSAEGVLVLEPGDIIVQLDPQVITESVKLTFKGGYVTKIEGGATGQKFEAILKGYNDKEAYGTSHVGFGTHENTDAASGIGHYHHNKSGSLLFALGQNQGHGLGGESMKYAGLGMTTRKAPNHSHFSVFKHDFIVDGQKVVDKGKLVI